MALAQNPKVLLLDEPFAGLSIDERRDVHKCLMAIPRDVTIVMIEHNMDVALDFAERITLLHFGEVIVEGTPRRSGRRSAHPGGLSWPLARSRSTAIDAFYGDSHVLQDVSFELGEARMLGLLGRNGAGKSTCMNVDDGPAAAAPRRRRRCSATPVTRLPPEQIAARGVALVPQGRRIFKSLTVRENLDRRGAQARSRQPSTRRGPSTRCSRCFRG